jgi:hypothetical protein
MRPEMVFKGKTFAQAGLKKPTKQITRKSLPNFNSRYIVLSAAQDNEVAWDGGNPDMPGGLFTSTLVQVINSARASMTFAQAMGYVKQRVTDQHPQLDSRFGNAATPLFEPIVTPIRKVNE